MSSNNLMISGMSGAQESETNEYQQDFSGAPANNFVYGEATNGYQFGQDYSGFHNNYFDASNQWVAVNSGMEQVGAQNIYYGNQSDVLSPPVFQNVNEAPAFNQVELSKESPACSMSQPPVNFSGSHPSQGYFNPQQNFMNEYFVESPQNQGQQPMQPQFYDFPQYEQEDVKAIIPTSRGRGRPKGSKNKTPEERPEKKKRVIDTDKTAFTYNHLITMAISNSPHQMATVQMLYRYSKHHFPSIASKDSWKNTLRHALAPMNGFARIESNAMAGKAGFWTILSERRDDLIKSIEAKIKENEDSMENLKMRDIGDLPAILSGNCPLPAEEIFEQMPIPTAAEGPSTVFNQTNEHFQNAYQQPYFFPDFAAQHSYAQYPSTSSAPMYSNHQEAAYPTGPLYPYGMPQPHNGMPYFAYPKQEFTGVNSPSNSVLQQEYQHYGFIDNYNQMNGGFPSSSVPQPTEGQQFTDFNTPSAPILQNYQQYAFGNDFAQMNQSGFQVESIPQLNAQQPMFVSQDFSPCVQQFHQMPDSNVPEQSSIPQSSNFCG